MTDTVEQTVEEEAVEETKPDLLVAEPLENGKALLVESDLDFIRKINSRSGGYLKKCMQCGTCSATCAISPDLVAFPSKEMAWAAWGLKDRLLKDPDVWLCHYCNDCSLRCPRGARPGDVLNAVRQESVVNNAFPSFFARWVNQPQSILVIFGIPALLISLMMGLREPLTSALNIAPQHEGGIVYPYSAMFPHWLLIGFFLLISLAVVAVTAVGAVRFWKTLKEASPIAPSSNGSKSGFPSFLTTLKNIILHRKFAECTRSASRFWSHTCVFFGFMSLCVVTFWIITSSINPLIKDSFVYPFNFWSPWKILANLGGLSLLVGCVLMIFNRFRDNDLTGSGNYYDWSLISILMLVVLSGFATEVIHYVRLEPHRHLIYFMHLVFVLGLIMYLPYSKFAHMIYRTLAMTYSELSGRNVEHDHTAKEVGNE